MAALTPEQVAQLAYQAGFRGDALTTIVAIAKRESGYNPSAYNGNAGTGDNSVGLTQINLIGDLLPARGKILQQLGYNVDPNNRQQVMAALQNPLANLQVAYVLSSNGTNFYPWGGYKGMSDTYGTDMQTAAQAVANAGLGGGDTGQHFAGSYGNGVQMANTTGGNGSPDYSSMAGQGRDILQNIAATKPDPSDFLPQRTADGTVLDPGGTASPAYQSALANWQKNYLDALKTVQSLQNASMGVAQLPDGSVVPIGDLTPEQADAINTSNLNNYTSLLNKYGLDSYSLIGDYVSGNNSNAVTDFNNKISALNAKMGIDSANLSSATADLSRWLDAQDVAENDQAAIAKAQQQVQQYGTTNGKTSFTGADLGGGVQALAAQANVAAGTPVIQYPGVETLNPVQDRLNSLAAMGISNTPPPIPYPTVTAADIPPVPGLSNLPPPPTLQAPQAPALVYPGTSGTSAGGAATTNAPALPPPVGILGSVPGVAYNALPPALRNLTLGGIPLFGNGG